MSVVVTKRSISSTSGDLPAESGEAASSFSIAFIAYSSLAYMRSLFSSEAGDLLRSSIFGTTSS
jgi:hypothetical protein